MRARRPPPAPHRRRGFTLVELAVVLGVLGLLALGMTSAFSNIHDLRLYDRARADAEAARQALRAFALREKRLPCPGSDASGREASPCVAGLDVGWLPYETLGLALPPTGARMRYAVHRGVGGGPDLVAPPLSASTDGHDIDGGHSFVAALTALAVATPSPQNPHHPLQHAPAGSTACAGAVANPAFLLVAPLADRDGRPGPNPNFDGMNSALAAGTGKCAAPPSRPPDRVSDDLVAAESGAALLGWISARSR
ncbi:prepilin-type N-terminal cleavage/methylation domain-containing protein [Luteimonas sp. RD2P54]|uniref:Prepilin-type N-terminal cleavage/methylation domain-containing protein n=1 Tax=Luteimonas endophytica TaxID=3042023 RepID=A0ABT6J462_9GAMM|nr:prepilin-type N-terminal cleavage/methylation domain-containing protein [Luteimonas endophytica]MDH5821606.1 prepilin-type N-terminal cleavage/methylation domain-containing protein [Luteimonas endophytica]